MSLCEFLLCGGVVISLLCWVSGMYDEVYVYLMVVVCVFDFVVCVFGCVGVVVDLCE